MARGLRRREVAAEADEVLVVVAQERTEQPGRGTRPRKLPLESTTARLDSPCLTAFQAGRSWLSPGATTGGSASMRSAARSSSSAATSRNRGQ
ncbi:MAG TPA: hypothetical protein VFR87_08690 [Nocardioidaceae bacterium]|nr:hypothetical protein [Nocardioidaceae bacterium]